MAARQHDISIMTRTLIIVLSFCAMVPALSAGSVASAQMLPPGASVLSPPPPPPLPPPKIEVPVVPQMDAMPPRQDAPRSSRGSFSDRVTTCLQDGAASGLGPNARAAYSRSFANQ